MKKLTALILVAAMVLAMTACRRKKSEPLAGTMEETVTKLIQAKPVEFMGGQVPVDLTDTSEDGMWAIKSFTGLQSGESLTDIAVYESMMGSHAFSLVAVRVAEGADAKAVAQEMTDNIDTRKWVCVGADEKIVAGYGDVVMLIMLDSGLELKAQDYVDAFQAICGELDFTI